MTALLRCLVGRRPPSLASRFSRTFPPFPPSVSRLLTSVPPISSIQWYGWGTSPGANTLPTSSTPQSEKITYDHPQPLVFAVPSSEKDSDSPPSIVPSSAIAEVSIGHDSVGFVTRPQTQTKNFCSAYIWGKGNAYGQLGLGIASDSPVSSPSPLLPPLPPGESVAKLRLGGLSSALISSSGDLYTWGWNGSAVSGMGQLGTGDGASRPSPAPVSSLHEDGCVVTDCGLGKSHAVVLTDEGEVLAAGAGSYGRLGNLESEDQLHFVPVDLLAGTPVAEIAVGNVFTLALAEDGTVHAWGQNDQSQLGLGGGFTMDMYSMENLPRMIEGSLEGRRVIKIAAGYGHSACITEEGECFMWGMKRFLEPELLTVLLHTRCVDVKCGRGYTAVLDDQGVLYTFGEGKTGCLGHADTKRLSQPQPLEAFQGRKVVQMHVGMDQIICAVEDE
uniref:RCC1-like domain-containing protein n=1 Tax=Corethron hystrix TaxID=216773 RepID=A0A7S1B633_9STRA